MAAITVERHGQVAVLRLSSGITHPINDSLVVELSASLDTLERDSTVRGVVLASANDKFFSIGFDLPQLYPLSRERFRDFYQGFNRLCLKLYCLSKPTAAALTGHAIAGGCILALCCDYRVIGEGRKLMGLNEIQLGVPVPYPAACMLQELVEHGTARDIVYGGEFFQAEELLTMGLVDEVLPVGEVLQGSITRVQAVGRFPGAALSLVKRTRTESVADRIRERLEEKEESFVECWFSPEARSRLKKAIERF